MEANGKGFTPCVTADYPVDSMLSTHKRGHLRPHDHTVNRIRFHTVMDIGGHWGP